MTKTRLIVSLLVAAHLSLDAVVATELWRTAASDDWPSQKLMAIGFSLALAQTTLMCAWLVFGTARSGWRLIALLLVIGLSAGMFEWLGDPGSGAEYRVGLTVLLLSIGAATTAFFVAARYFREWQIVASDREPDSSMEGDAHQHGHEESVGRDIAANQGNDERRAMPTSTARQVRIADFLLWTTALALFFGVAQPLKPVSMEELVRFMLRHQYMILLLALSSTVAVWLVVGDGWRRWDGWLITAGCTGALAHWLFVLEFGEPFLTHQTVAELTYLLLSLAVLRVAGLRLVQTSRANRIGIDTER